MIFKLDKQLEKDTYFIKESADYLLLIHKNALVPWLILVPKTDETELFNCDKAFKTRIHHAVDYYASTMQTALTPDKLNIASIGNIVTQMHIHIIGRFVGDFAWPAPVWGRIEKQDYELEQVELLKQLFLTR